MLKIAKLFYFYHLKKLVRPETFGPYYVQEFPEQTRFSSVLVTNANGHRIVPCTSE